MPTFTVTTLSDSGAGSLRDAMNRAQSGDTIRFDASLANQTILLTGGQLTVAAGKNLIIDGSDATNLTISGNRASRIFFVNSTSATPTNLTVRNLNLVDAYTSGRGGAIATTHQAQLTVENVNFSRNVADLGGGAIFSEFEGSLLVKNSNFDANEAVRGNDERGAGAIAFWGPGPITIQNSEFTNNKGINGGAINSLNGKLTIENSRFLNNTTTAARYDTGKANPSLRGYGGAIYTDRATAVQEPSGTIRITDTVFEGNQSKAGGGAAYLYTGTQDNVIVEGSLFRNNQTFALPGGEGGSGGGLLQITNGANRGFTLRNTSFVGNTADGSGGGIWVMGSPTTVTNSTFSGNRSIDLGYGGNGGGLAFYGATATITNSTIANNRAGWAGGGIMADNSATVTLRNTILANNTADNGGNTWNINQHTNRLLTDAGGNIQTRVANDNATASVTIGDPMLAALQEVDGALLHPLQSSSAAINVGVSGGPTTDERGFTRDSRPDSGAYEYNGVNLPPLGSLRINDVTLTEGNSGTTNAVFTVTLSAITTQTVRVNYTTANGTAMAGSDYTAMAGTLVWNPGQTTQTITIPIIGDTRIEPNETFTVNLSLPTNATIADGQGLGTIRNDDQPGLSMADVAIVEGNSGQLEAIMTIRLSAASSQAISVNYATADGTATAGVDYNALSGSLTFKAGETSKTIRVAILGDTAIEANETLFVNLTNPTGASITDGQGLLTIRNDDTTLGSPSRTRLGVDMSGDGRADMVWRNPVSGANMIWTFSGGVRRQEKALASAGQSWQMMGTADLDGDGQGELIWWNSTTASVSAWQIRNSQIVSKTGFGSTGYVQAPVAGMGDFNGDGKVDLLIRHRGKGTTTIWEMDGLRRSRQLALPSSTDIRWEVKAIGDLTGDNQAEIVWQHPGGRVAIWSIQNSTYQSAVQFTPTSSSDKVQGMGDFDGNGQYDILLRDTRSGAVTIWQMNGLTREATIALPTKLSANQQIVDIADLNSDGKSDIVFRDTVTGANGVWFMNSILQTGTTGSANVLVRQIPTIADTNWQSRV